MPILGILASSTPAAAGDFESIATVTVGAGGAADVTFSSIPNTYTHLQLRALVRTNRGSSLDNIFMRFNNDTASNYYQHRLEGDGSSVYSDGYGGTGIPFTLSPTSADLSNSFGAAVMDILDYTSTNKNKTGRTLHGVDLNGSGWMTFRSQLWFKTPEAITSIKLYSQNSANISQYSHFALYGIKSA